MRSISHLKKFFKGLQKKTFDFRQNAPFCHKSGKNPPKKRYYDGAMEVYIEDVFIDNFIINFILLFTTAKIMHLDARWWQLALATLLGVGASILTLFISITGVALVGFKLLLSILMVLCICTHPSLQKFFLAYLAFLCLTFIIGGACLALALTIGEVFISESGQVSYTLALPMGFIIGIAFGLAYIIAKLFVSLKNRLLRQNFMFSATLNGFKIKAFLDTGNRLCDPATGKPITIISFEYFEKIFKDVSLATIILRKKCDKLRDMHFIKANTIAPDARDIMVFCVDTLNLSQNKEKITIKNALLGLSFAGIGKSLDCGLLLNPLLLNGEYNE